MNDYTEDWKLYEYGKSYNQRLKPNYYDTVDTNVEFLAGNQWIGANVSEIPKPVFNIIKRIATFLVASLTNTKTVVGIEPFAFKDDDFEFEFEMNASKFVNAEIDNIFNEHDFDTMIKDALLDGITSGDYCMHVYFDPSAKAYGGMGRNVMGKIRMELVDGVNVYFGNANSRNTEGQPYILITGRDTIENLNKEYKIHNKKKKDTTEFAGDSDYEEQAGQGGKIEIDGDDSDSKKATYVIKYFMGDNGTVHVNKSVKGDYIFKNIDTGLSRYPIAWGNWEKQKNQYHGRAFITGVIPNQIFINRMFAMVMYYLQANAFQKPVYNADKLSSWNSDIGVALPLRNMQSGDSVQSVAGYLPSGQYSPSVNQAIEMTMQYTKETLGITDASLGDVKPYNTSAIIAVQKASSVPLEMPKAYMYSWVKDLVNILMDMMGTYYGERPIVMNIDGVKQIVPYDFSVLKELMLNVKVDVGSGSYFSQVAMVQTLDNLLANEKISFIQYLERIPSEYVPDKDKLIEEIKATMEQEQLMQMQMMQQQMMQGQPQL